ncbi:hypothetical protein [Caldivirga maquilingensis]|uniref:Uncharacterized protein n=1 Tax=Caldivirga maquilingensis (strain ATCC 700844 / DSM 13496 / JCM 10307 / IC-167) TaxID=397948 RepID=A8M938_CALMQ|nr:hypothetical protein [Caldivirga maquilingensis]ABW02257.1 hypothetical protein Cmaq_1432 [Caldivirga maquilingensis IC-167]
MFTSLKEAQLLVKEFLSRSIDNVGLSLISTIRRRAIRLNAWWRLNPIKRGLLEAALTYMRRGGSFKSRIALTMIKDAVVDALTIILTGSIRFMAYVVGLRLMSRLSHMPHALKSWELIILGIQWLNTPLIYRAPLI